MDNRQQAVCDRLESRLVELLTADPDWETAAEQIADALEVTTPHISNPKMFVASVASALPNLAREAVSRGMSPADAAKASSPLDLVNNLLP